MSSTEVTNMSESYRFNNIYGKDYKSCNDSLNRSVKSDIISADEITLRYLAEELKTDPVNLSGMITNETNEGQIALFQNNSSIVIGNSNIHEDLYVMLSTDVFKGCSIRLNMRFKKEFESMCDKMIRMSYKIRESHERKSAHELNSLKDITCSKIILPFFEVVDSILRDPSNDLEEESIREVLNSYISKANMEMQLDFALKSNSEVDICDFSIIEQRWIVRKKEIDRIFEYFLGIRKATAEGPSSEQKFIQHMGREDKRIAYYHDKDGPGRFLIKDSSGNFKLAITDGNIKKNDSHSQHCFNGGVDVETGSSASVESESKRLVGDKDESTEKTPEENSDYTNWGILGCIVAAIGAIFYFGSKD